MDPRLAAAGFAAVTLAAAALAIPTLLLPSTASAANGLRPRTPAVFTDTPCAMRIEAGTVASFDYTVPFDDTELSPEELDDSRRMQFFAFRQLHFDYRLPTYVSQADHDRAQANGDNTKSYGAQDILEAASAWPASSWTAITTADPRAPITAEQAAMGFDWDTTGVSPGAWVLAAYTWEPENNLWSYRLGVVRVVEPGNPDAAGPAAFFDASPDAPAAQVGDSYVMAGCIDAAPGSTYSASYGILEGLDEPTWVPFVDDAEAPSGDLMLALTAPSEAGGKSIKVRIDVTDPSGQSYVAYSPYPVLVLGGGTTSADGTEDGTGEAGADSDDDGGRCRVGRKPLTGGGVLFLVLLAGLRRRAERITADSRREPS